MKLIHQISEPLQELNKMIGMKELKNNIVDQIIYLMQELHIIKNKIWHGWLIALMKLRSAVGGDVATKHVAGPTKTMVQASLWEETRRVYFQMPQLRIRILQLRFLFCNND